jgi:hypothetical protein
MVFRISNHDATPSELRHREQYDQASQGSEAQPWAGICERFQRLVTRLETGPSKALQNHKLRNIYSLHFTT